MAKVKLPAGPHELTAEWLTEALRSTGTISSSCVKSFASEIIGEGAGLIGQLVRVTPHYDSREPRAPRSLIGKFPAEVPENREIGNVFRLYEREVRFYEEIASEVELRTPRRYYSAMDIDRGDYILLLEDLAPARLGDQITGCSVAEAELALRELAKFHATWWDSPRLGELDWMPFFNDAAIVQSVKDSFKYYWPPFQERFRTILPSYIAEIAETFPEDVAGIMDRLTLPPRTIIHGDYRLDNLFFGQAGGVDTLAAIDWQISARGRGVFDVAYFIAGSLPFKEREARDVAEHALHVQRSEEKHPEESTDHQRNSSVGARDVARLEDA